ncbi:phycobilisome rod-core linker polypeptide [Leptolyngbya iicbica]|uniref:Phycobilisome linker polypeptide n=2 Tax=Cyanophyceae TaxID=3028117 RepID=A0A4Q7E9L5_9CYAN|nr:phycobilisome rod-core linker polypeptide [Leptolyngbya sp. LK]RZM79312.1 phycobilisome linker polypeptide [Leptolyngbya sp. LK]
MEAIQETIVSRRSSLEERQAALYQIYTQVLERQPYASEHRQLAKPEKDFLKDKIGVKRFLKALGTSEVYLNEFYYSSSNLKFLELCFKHFMGRAPKSHAEMSEYSDILMREGVKELITKMIDSEEYRKHFGCFTVPHPYPEKVYESPKAYLENDLLINELHGRRGTVMPTMLWHELGLQCDGGTCAAQSESLTFGDHEDHDRVELLQVLRRIHPEDLEEVAAALPPQQRETLSRALLHLKR